MSKRDHHEAGGNTSTPLEAAIRTAAFRSALQAFLRGSDGAVRSGGLTPQRYMLLLLIKGAPDGSQRATVSDLAKRLHLAPNTVSELVRRAEELGLVQREGSARDGRIAELRLSDRGARLLAGVLARHLDDRNALRQKLDELEQFDEPDRCEEKSTSDRSFTAEQVVIKLREIERLLADGADVVQACRHLGISVQAFQRWRAQLNAIGPDELMRLRQLEKENTRLKQLLAEKELDNAALRESTRVASADWRRPLLKAPRAAPAGDLP